MSEEMIVRNCSPTLAGMKTGSMFTCSYESVEGLRREIRQMNKRLAVKGLRILPLRICNERAIIYVYRPKKLKNDLSCKEVTDILEKQGYQCETPERCIARLIDRLQNLSDFPHEVGLFLGYPPEDVRGFIENNAESPKFTGCWKVYGDEEKAKHLFNKYKKCTSVYMNLLINGKTIERLTVVG